MAAILGLVGPSMAAKITVNGLGYHLRLYGLSLTLIAHLFLTRLPIASSTKKEGLELQSSAVVVFLGSKTLKQNKSIPYKHSV